MTELNTELPTSGMLCGKSKWEVGKPRIIGVSTAPRRWRVARHTIEEAGKKRHTWTVMGTHPWSYRDFPTWREALEYADQRARTREYVLPRISRSGDWVPSMPTLKIGWEHHHTGTTFWVEDRGINSITVRPDELRPLANALHALAEQEVTQ